MALAFVQSQKGSSTAGTGSYTTSAFGSSVTVGNAIFACVSSDGNNAGQITGVADSKGNTYSKIFEQVGASRSFSIWAAKVTTGGTGLTLTPSYNAASSNNSGVVFQEWSGFTGTPAADQSKGANGTSATPATGNSAATTVAAELVIAACVMNSTEASFTAGTGYSNGDAALVTNANIGMQSKVVSSTGVQAAGFTWPTSRAYACGLVTIYDNAGGGGAPGSFFFAMPK